MPDPKDDTSKTGQFDLSQLEPPLEREPKRPSSLPEVSEGGSTTGVMRIYREGTDDSAKRDEDQPA